MEKINWNEVEEAQEFERVQPGGYVCKVVKVEDYAEKQYIKVWADITEGKYKGYGEATEARTQKDWGYLTFIKSYKPKALPFFKGFLTALEESNKNFKVTNFDGDEKKLVGLAVGLIACEEEYRNQSGDVKIRLKVDRPTSVAKIKKGDFKVPDLKKLAELDSPMESMGTEAKTDAADLPF